MEESLPFSLRSILYPGTEVGESRESREVDPIRESPPYGLRSALPGSAVNPQPFLSLEEVRREYPLPDLPGLFMGEEVDRGSRGREGFFRSLFQIMEEEAEVALGEEEVFREGDGFLFPQPT